MKLGVKPDLKQQIVSSFPLLIFYIFVSDFLTAFLNKFITFFNFPPFSMNDKRIRKSLMEGSFTPILNSINCKVMEKLTKLITLNYDDLLFEVNFRVLALTRFLLSFSVLCVHSYLFSVCFVYSWIPLLTCFFLFDWHNCLLSNISR